jgi:hypothetical protein
MIENVTTCLYILLCTYKTEENMEKVLPGVVDKMLQIEEEHLRLYPHKKDIDRFFKPVWPQSFRD